MQLSAFEAEDYITVGCTSGIYLSKHAVNYCESLYLSRVLVTQLVTHSISEDLGIQ